MLALSRALSCIAVLATMGCNLDNNGDAPPRGLLYFPNAITLSAHDPTTPATHLLVANSNFDLRYHNGTVQSYSLAALDEALEASRDPDRSTCTPGPECIIDPASAMVDEALVGAFSTGLAVSSDGGAVFVTTRTDDTLGVVGLDADGRLSGCGDLACNARTASDAPPRSEPLRWPGNPVAVIAGPLTHWTGTERALPGDYVLVAHRTGEVTLFVYRPSETPGAPGDLVFVDALAGLPQVLTEMAYDASTRLVHLSVAGGSTLKILGRIGVAIPATSESSDPALEARLYDAGSLELASVSTGNDSRDLAFVPAIPDGGAAASGARALVLSNYPAALLVVDVDPRRNAGRAARVEDSVALGVGAQRLVTGTLDGRPFAIVACFDARQLFVIDLSTMLVRSVVPNLSGPFDLTLDEARKLLYLTDFRSSVIRIVDLGPVVLPGVKSGEPAQVVATLGVPQVLPELQ